MHTINTSVPGQRPPKGLIRLGGHSHQPPTGTTMSHTDGSSASADFSAAAALLTLPRASGGIPHGNIGNVNGFSGSGGQMMNGNGNLMHSPDPSNWLPEKVCLRFTPLNAESRSLVTSIGKKPILDLTLKSGKTWRQVTEYLFSKWVGVDSLDSRLVLFVQWTDGTALDSNMAASHEAQHPISHVIGFVPSIQQHNIFARQNGNEDPPLVPIFYSLIDPRLSQTNAARIIPLSLPESSGYTPSTNHPSLVFNPSPNPPHHSMNNNPMQNISHTTPLTTSGLYTNVRSNSPLSISPRNSSTPTMGRTPRTPIHSLPYYIGTPYSNGDTMLQAALLLNSKSNLSAVDDSVTRICKEFGNFDSANNTQFGSTGLTPSSNNISSLPFTPLTLALATPGSSGLEGVFLAGLGNSSGIISGHPFQNNGVSAPIIGTETNSEGSTPLALPDSRKAVSTLVPLTENGLSHDSLGDLMGASLMWGGSNLLPTRSRDGFSLSSFLQSQDFPAASLPAPSATRSTGIALNGEESSGVDSSSGKLSSIGKTLSNRMDSAELTEPTQVDPAMTNLLPTKDDTKSNLSRRSGDSSVLSGAAPGMSRGGERLFGHILKLNDIAGGNNGNTNAATSTSTLYSATPAQIVPVEGGSRSNLPHETSNLSAVSNSQSSFPGIFPTRKLGANTTATTTSLITPLLEEKANASVKNSQLEAINLEKTTNDKKLVISNVLPPPEDAASAIATLASLANSDSKQHMVKTLSSTENNIPPPADPVKVDEVVSSVETGIINPTSKLSSKPIIDTTLDAIAYLKASRGRRKRSYASIASSKEEKLKVSNISSTSEVDNKSIITTSEAKPVATTKDIAIAKVTPQTQNTTLESTQPTPKKITVDRKSLPGALLLGNGLVIPRRPVTHRLAHFPQLLSRVGRSRPELKRINPTFVRPLGLPPS